MNMELDALRRGIAPVLRLNSQLLTSISDATEMIRVRKQVQRDHDSAGISADIPSIMSAVYDYCSTGKVESFRDLKYVCLGVGIVDTKGHCLLASEALRSNILNLSQDQIKPDRRLRCFQSLLSSYWAFPKNSSTVTAASRHGWDQLRCWLREEYDQLLTILPASNPIWFSRLSQHLDLLSRHPCDRYGKALLYGDSSPFNEAVETLVIPQDSWVMDEVIYAQILAGTGLDDAEFKSALCMFLPIATGSGTIETGGMLRSRCVAALVSRYARCESCPEVASLRDAAIKIIGNPWLKQTSWDAWVRDTKNNPDDQARAMITGWLKRQLIHDFFALLSFEGKGDVRRLNYWLRFATHIDSMWFALGTDAQFQRGENFEDFRARAKGNILNLDNTTADNNAFIMRIGKYLVVEFGAKGNAFYLFEWDYIGQRLKKVLSSGKPRGIINIGDLKASNYINKRRVHSGEWERNFDDELCPLFGVWQNREHRVMDVRAPNSTNNTGNFILSQQWSDYVRLHQLKIEDNRSKGGAYWVLGLNLTSEIAKQLAAWGFRVSPTGRFFWFEET
jgi:hypothetical protein